MDGLQQQPDWQAYRLDQGEEPFLCVQTLEIVSDPQARSHRSWTHSSGNADHALTVYGVREVGRYEHHHRVDLPVVRAILKINGLRCPTLRIQTLAGVGSIEEETG